jgi:hypothetical protein
MKFEKPTIAGLKKAGINTAGLFVGVLGGFAMQNFLMKERTAKDGTVKKPIIEDNILFNGVGALLGVGVAMTIPNPFAKFVGLGMAVIFTIRAVNRATDKLSGLSGTANLKTFLEKAVPRINGVAFDIPMGGADYINEPLMLPMSGFGDMGRNEAFISPAASEFTNPLAIPALTTSSAGRHA